MKKITRFIPIIAATILLGGCVDIGNGDKVGSITKIAQEGVFCKTWEGQIIRGGFQNGSGASGAPFHFTIENNPELVKKMQHYMDTQQEIKITYRTEMFTFCRSDSGNHFLVDAVPLGQSAERPMKVDTTKAIPVVAVPVTDPRAQVETREDKIMKLLQVQQQLITELAASKK